MGVECRSVVAETGSVLSESVLTGLLLGPRSRRVQQGRRGDRRLEVSYRRNTSFEESGVEQVEPGQIKLETGRQQS